MIPRVLSRGTSTVAQRAHFLAILEAAGDLPAVIYNSPYYGFETRAELFFELRSKYANLIGFKEFGGAAALSYATENITGKNPELTLRVYAQAMPVEEHDLAEVDVAAGEVVEGLVDRLDLEGFDSIGAGQRVVVGEQARP